MDCTDCVALDFSEAAIERLADRVANEIFKEVLVCANRQYPWEEPVAPSMEALGEKVMTVALAKFYQCCG